MRAVSAVGVVNAPVTDAWAARESPRSNPYALVGCSRAPPLCRKSAMGAAQRSHSPVVGAGAVVALRLMRRKLAMTLAAELGAMMEFTSVIYAGGMLGICGRRG